MLIDIFTHLMRRRFLDELSQRAPEAGGDVQAAAGDRAAA